METQAWFYHVWLYNTSKEFECYYKYNETPLKSVMYNKIIIFYSHFKNFILAFRTLHFSYL